MGCLDSVLGALAGGRGGARGGPDAGASQAALLKRGDRHAREWGKGARKARALPAASAT